MYADRFRMIGQKIARCRKMQGMTQEELSKKVGISLSYMKKIESSKSDRAFSLYVLFQLADELAIDTADLVKPSTEFQDLIFESKNGCKLNPISNKNQEE